VLKAIAMDGQRMTKRSQNANVYVNPTTNLLQVYQSDAQS